MTWIEMDHLLADTCAWLLQSEETSNSVPTPRHLSRSIPQEEDQAEAWIREFVASQGTHRSEANQRLRFCLLPRLRLARPELQLWSMLYPDEAIPGITLTLERILLGQWHQNNRPNWQKELANPDQLEQLNRAGAVHETLKPLTEVRKFLGII